MSKPEKNRSGVPDEARKSLYCRLVEQHYSLAFRLAMRLLMNEDTARDVVQECFLKVWMNFDSYDEEKRFSTWLYKIVSNACFDQWRKNKRKQVAYAASVADWENELAASPEEKYVQNETMGTIRELCESLPPRQRLVFMLRDLEQLEMNEVCEITELDVNQVKANLYYARSQMRIKLEKVNKTRL
jgi:RNA polymerase sigma-70 factor, ECF subfamily